MRTVIVNNIVSLDGYYADPTGNPLALNMDAAFDRANLETIATADLILLGRDSFDGFSAHWPFVADASEPENPEAPEAQAFNETNRAISRHYNRIPKVVVTDRGPIPDDNPWAATTTTITKAALKDWLTAAVTDGNGNIVIFASRITWNALLTEELIDELHLMVSPVALAHGIPLFTSPAQLELLNVRRFDDSSNMQLMYRPGAISQEQP